MEMKEFINQIAEALTAFFGEKIAVQERQVYKNNGVLLHGVMIKEEDSNIWPTIYVDDMYEEFLHGKSMGVIVSDICKAYEKSRISGSVNMDFFQDYEQTKQHIYCRIINFEKNKGLLETVPYLRFHDLAVICYYAYISDLMGSGSIVIRREHLQYWEISEEDLLREAIEMTRRDLPYFWYDMSSFVETLCNGQEVDELWQGYHKPMYVVTNQNKYFGAIAIIYEDMLEEMGKLIGDNFVILPSSIHEVIVVSADRMPVWKLKAMVKEVNAEHVEPQEVLSDHVYYYDRNEKQLLLL